MFNNQHQAMNEETNSFDEYTLVCAAKIGNAEAFGELYKMYNQKIYRYIKMTIRDEEAACDLTHETFLTAWKSLLQLRDPYRFSPWLYRIAKNQTRNYYKRKKKILFLSWDRGNELGRGL